LAHMLFALELANLVKIRFAGPSRHHPNRPAADSRGRTDNG
jgi:hypothetical protein